MNPNNIGGTNETAIEVSNRLSFPHSFSGRSIALKSERDDFESGLCNHYMILVSYPTYVGLDFPSAKWHCTCDLQGLHQILYVLIFAQQRLVNLFFLSQLRQSSNLLPSENKMVMTYYMSINIIIYWYFFYLKRIVKLNVVIQKIRKKSFLKSFSHDFWRAYEQLTWAKQECFSFMYLSNFKGSIYIVFGNSQYFTYGEIKQISILCYGKSSKKYEYH